MTKNVLLIPGFMADTYSEIESALIELSLPIDDGISIVWLVPAMERSLDRYKDPANRDKLREPLYVTHLKKTNVRYVIGELSRTNPIRNYLLLARVFRDHNICAVYTHFGIERFWAAFVAKLCNKTTIWNEHWNSIGMRYGVAKRLFYRTFVDYFISVSEYTSRSLPAGSRIYTILNSIDTTIGPALTVTERTQLSTRLGVPPDVRMVLMVAAFRPEKRHDLAYTICKQICGSRDDVVFVFLGDGALRGSFMDRVRRDGLEGRMMCPGHVLNTEDYYLASDICMLTSIGEPFGYCVLEAMKYSRPMVVFASGGPLEIVRDGDTGVLVRENDLAGFADAVTGLLQNGERRERIGSRARRSVEEEFSRTCWKAKIRAAIKEMVGST